MAALSGFTYITCKGNDPVSLTTGGGTSGNPLEFFGGVSQNFTPSLPLFIRAISGVASGTCFLTISGGGALQTSGSTYLTILGGVAGTLTKTLNLTVFNQGTTSGLYLYTRGAGTTEGSLPLSGGPCYLTILNYGVDNTIPLYIQGKEAMSGFLYLTTSGVTSATGQLWLSMPNVSAPLSLNIPLFVRGF